MCITSLAINFQFSGDDLSISFEAVSSALSSFANWSLSSSLAVVKMFPSRYELMSGKFLSKSTVFGIRDTLHGWTGWVFRVDKPHKGADFEHVNFNWIYTRKRDPHYKLPAGTTTAFGVLNTLVSGVKKFVVYVALAADAYR